MNQPLKMSSWKDSSDFASLSAALSQMKKKKSEGADSIVEAKEQDKFETIAETKESTDEPQKSETAKDLTKVEGEATTSVNESTIQASSTEPCIAVSKNFPKFHCTLPAHKSVVCCLCFENSGARLISGSHDANIAYWDFAGTAMDDPSPFRFIQPLGNNPIRSICPSPDSQWFLFAAATPAAKLFDRNGAQIREYAKGDPYLRDLRHTIGHVAALTSACWCPGDEDRFWTASEDGSIRQWHIGYRAASEAVLPIRSRTPQRCLVSAVACVADQLIVGAADGILRLFPLRTYSKSSPPPVSPTSEHQMTGRISCLAVETKENLLAARTVEGEVCVYRIQAGKFEIVARWTDLASSFEEVSLCFARLADGALALFTGCKRGLARLSLDSKAAEILPFPSAEEVAAVTWHQATGQLALGHASGKISVFLSESGRGGARLMAATAKGSKVSFGEADISAGDLYASTAGGRVSSRRKAEKIRADPLATHRPELPVYGQGQGGRLGSNVTQQIMRQVLKDTTRDVDPREALLAYAEKAAKNPKWVATAYAQTQPETILDEKLLEKEAQVEEERKRRHEEMERLQSERKKREKF